MSVDRSRVSDLHDCLDDANSVVVKQDPVVIRCGDYAVEFISPRFICGHQRRLFEFASPHQHISALPDWVWLLKASTRSQIE
jgi:hypothetical protein